MFYYILAIKFVELLSELAFEVDSVREVISRNLKSIEKRGYIKIKRGRIIVLKDLNEMLKS
ncbi:hypothetical protein AXY43_02705 [Clostridium sp. MF28]|nr:hypothetical protein AXY43_02705 [Clostridium sp. MF28]NOV60539.1 DNA-binding MarR family transcriptional regulator [Clostridium beijerinckii]NOV70684.1 DNA-binding MarR family transcriptional regulator [Clostridium beijerinckii]NOW83269.1 DNA-binding MarR family transcriptional regulator [Clostridium beijerinckii]